MKNCDCSHSYIYVPVLKHSVIYNGPCFTSFCCLPDISSGYLWVLVILVYIKCMLISYWYLLCHIRCIFCFGLFVGFGPSREFFNQMETSPWPVKCCKIWPMLGTHGHWQWEFFSLPQLLWHGHPFTIVIFGDLWQSPLLPSVVSGAATACFYESDLFATGIRTPGRILWPTEPPLRPIGHNLFK